MKPEDRLKRLDEVETKLDEKSKSIDTKLGALDAKLERARQKSVVQKLRQLGADPDLISDGDILTLVPAGVDPDEPAGLAELVKWKEARPRLFKKADVGPQESLGDYVKRVNEDTRLTDRQKARKAKMAGRLMGGD